MEKDKQHDDEKPQLPISSMLARDRHERMLDWVAVSILASLIGLSIFIIVFYMIDDGEPDQASLGWAKTFLTTLGGTSIGVLARSGAYQRKHERQNSSSK